MIEDKECLKAESFLHTKREFDKSIKFLDSIENENIKKDTFFSGDINGSPSYLIGNALSWYLKENIDGFVAYAKEKLREWYNRDLQAAKEELEEIKLLEPK